MALGEGRRRSREGHIACTYIHTVAAGHGAGFSADDRSKACRPGTPEPKVAHPPTPKRAVLLVLCSKQLSQGPSPLSCKITYVYSLEVQPGRALGMQLGRYPSGAQSALGGPASARRQAEVIGAVTRDASLGGEPSWQAGRQSRTAAGCVVEIRSVYGWRARGRFVAILHTLLGACHLCREGNVGGGAE